MHSHPKSQNGPPVRQPPDDHGHNGDCDLPALLSAHRDFLFAPDPHDLSKTELQAQVRSAMDQTRSIRPSRNRFTAVFVHPAVALALAAGICIALGIWWFQPFAKRTPQRAPWSDLPANTIGLILPEKLPAADIHAKFPSLVLGIVPDIHGFLPMASLLSRLVFRGGDHAMESDIPLFDPANPPVAYLFRNEADVRITRDPDIAIHVQSPCIPLTTNDRATIAGRMPAIMLFPTRIVRLDHPGEYRIGPDGAILHESGPHRQPREQVFSAPPLVLPPDQLLGPASIAKRPDSPSLRSPAFILSPIAHTYSQTPDIIWIGNDTDTLELTLDPLAPLQSTTEPAPAQPSPPSSPARTTQVKGGLLTWAETGWPPLPRATAWQITLRHHTREIAAAAINILPEADAQTLQARLDEAHHLIPEGHPRLFAEASILLQNSPPCAAEARSLAMRLWHAPGGESNLVYMKLVQQAYARMGLPIAVQQMRRRIHVELTKHLAPDQESIKE